jgi:dimethylargininase
MELAARQHQKYQSELSRLGCTVHTIPTASGLADSVFIEDTALVLDEVAVICRPGAPSRREEVPAVSDHLARYRAMASIASPGTLDGGDLLQVDKLIYAGLSSRSNLSGISQLRDIVAAHGYSVIPVETNKCLHLKSAVTCIGAGKLLLNPGWIDRSLFNMHEIIETHGDESHAANAVLIGENLIYPDSFPRTMEKLLSHGFEVIPVDVSELQKAEGAVTCCSLIFESREP